MIPTFKCTFCFKTHLFSSSTVTMSSIHTSFSIFFCVFIPCPPPAIKYKQQTILILWYQTAQYKGNSNDTLPTTIFHVLHSYICKKKRFYMRYLPLFLIITDIVGTTYILNYMHFIYIVSLVYCCCFTYIISLFI